MDAVNWVPARHACSPGAMFEKLRQEVEADVRSRNQLRPEQAHYGFRFTTLVRVFRRCAKEINSANPSLFSRRYQYYGQR
jgi:hypothetical protein